MPSTLTPERNKKNQDDVNNPSQHDYDAKFNDITSNFETPSTDSQDIENYANNSTAKDLQKLENYANDPANSGRYDGDPHNKTDQTVNAKDQEEQPWKNKVSPEGVKTKGKQALVRFKSFMKKKGPLGLVGGMLLGGGGMMSFFGGPGLLIVNLKEKMTEQFSDQVAAMSERNIVLLKKKFKGTTTGFCTSKLSIRCRFETMSTRQVKKLEKAGIKVNSTGETFLRGRIKIDNLEYEGVKTNANQLERRLYTEPRFRGAMLKGYNPKLAAYADSLFTKLTAKLGIKKDKNVTPNEAAGEASDKLKEEAEKASEEATEARSAAEEAEQAAQEAQEAAVEEGTEAAATAAEEARQEATEAQEYANEATRKALEAEQNLQSAGARAQLVDIASGADAIEAKLGVSKDEEDCDGGSNCEDGKRTVYKDSNGETISESEYNKAVENGDIMTDELKDRAEAAKVGETIAKGSLKGALTSTSLGVGAVDTACTGYMVIRTVGFMAKYAGAMQLLRYAFSFMNTADSIKAGDGTEDQTNFTGEVLSAPNAQGKSATDSYGYKYTAYGDVAGMPKNDDVQAESMDENNNNIVLSEEEQQKVLLDNEVNKYVNGQLISNNLLTDIIGLISGAASVTQADDICKFTKSGWGQTIVIGASVAGAVVAFFSGGLSLTWGAGAQLAVSIGFSIAIATLTPKLVEMASGTLINGYENGNQAGNAITSGMGGFNAQTSQARGLPALQEEAAIEYQALTQQTMAQYREIDRTEHSPLDPTNPNTFMGSLVAGVVPYTSKISDIGSGISALKQFTGSAFSGLLPTASAVDPADQFKVCPDTDYKQLDLAVDPFCNVRYGLKRETLKTDPIEVYDYMTDHNYIDETTGQPKEDDNEYAEYIKNCVDRSVSLGGYASEDDTNKGEECIQDHHKGEEEHKYNMFRLSHIDTSVDEGMENGYANSTANKTTNGEVVSPVAPNHTLVGGYGPRGSVAGASNATSWHAAIDVNSTPKDVFAAMAGEVVFVEGNGANVVTIKHADGLKTNYLHMWPDDVLVKVGDQVTAGQKIGTIGCAGQAEGLCSGDHLDFNIWIDEVKDKSAYSKYKTAPSDAGGSAGKAINPANFLKDNGVTGYEDFVNDL